jgi:hypothetical protein
MGILFILYLKKFNRGRVDLPSPFLLEAIFMLSKVEVMLRSRSTLITDNAVD